MPESTSTLSTFRNMNFAKDVFGNMLEEVADWINNNCDPEDIFDDESLRYWAESNGWTAPE